MLDVAQTRPVIDYYERQGKVVAVAGQLPPDQVYERITAQLGPSVFHHEVRATDCLPPVHR